MHPNDDLTANWWMPISLSSFTKCLLQ